MNGHAANGNGTHTPSQAQEVNRLTLKTLKLLTDWIHQAETDPSLPACKWANSAQLRKARAQLEGNASSSTMAFELQDRPSSEEAIFDFLRQTLVDSVNPWTHRFLDKLYAAPTTLSPALELMLGALNASGVVSSASPALCLAEEQCVEALARLLGWDDTLVDGLTMPGGSASNVLAVQTALGNAFPSFKSDGILGVAMDLAGQGRKGRAARPLLLTSEASHYSLEKAALACGMGLDSVVKVQTTDTGAMDMQDLDRILTEALLNKEGKEGLVAGYPFFLNATSGTTILRAFDDLAGIADIVRRHRPTSTDHLSSTSNGDSSTFSHSTLPIWLHVDASWGGPVIFSWSHAHLMKGVEAFDSLTINPHKILNITQQCSFLLCRHGVSLGVNVTGAKYLFHGAGDASQRPTREALRMNPGAKTMGCGRRPDAYKFYVEWLRTGTTGFGQHVDRAINYAREILELVEGRYGDALEVAERVQPRGKELFLQVCFRPRPPADLLQALSDETTKGESAAFRHRLASSATHYVHQQLRNSSREGGGRFTVDKAPLSYRQGKVVSLGYYTRLVLHPTPPLATYAELVKEISQLGEEYYQGWQSRLDSKDGLTEWRRQLDEVEM